METADSQSPPVPGLVQLRLTGQPGDVAGAMALLRRFTGSASGGAVMGEQSRQYPLRGPSSNVRVYVQLQVYRS